MDTEIITLSTESGNSVKFELLDMIQIENREFIVVVPLQCDEVTILEIEYGSNEDSVFIGIEDESMLLTVWREFKERNNSRFRFCGTDDFL